MTVDRAWASIADRISDRQVLELEQSAIRIPSTTFEEGKLADHLASYMADAGLDVEMMEVSHPARPGQRTRPSARNARQRSTQTLVVSRTNLATYAR